MDDGEFQQLSEHGVRAFINGGGGILEADTGALHRFHRPVVELPSFLSAVLVGEIHCVERVGFRKHIRHRVYALAHLIGDAVAEEFRYLMGAAQGFILSGRLKWREGMVMIGGFLESRRGPQDGCLSERFSQKLQSNRETR